jgi:hypothetical protein
MSSYQIVTNGGSITVVDTDPATDGDDGTDTLTNIESLRFKDGTVSLAAPIVLDLDGNGTDLLSASQSNAKFDMDGDGKPDDTSWFGAGDAILFLDRDGNGTVSNAKEFSFVDDVPGAKSGLEGLKAFDSNGDGVLSSDDSRFGDFRLWQDKNGDGVATASEITTLSASQVASINLTGTPTHVTAKPGDAVAVNTGTFTKADGSSGMFADAAFTFFSGAKDAAAKPVALEDSSFAKKADKYQVVAQGGQLFVNLRKAQAALDPAAGQVGPATMMHFRDKTFGILTPIVLDLDGNGVKLRNRKHVKAGFDMDGDGSRDDTGWTSKGDGFLVIDRDGDGLITSAAELSFLSEKPDAKSDLDALGALDSNQDGKIDANDLRFGELKIWADRNGNGITDPGELEGLADAGIASISLASTPTKQSVKPGDSVLLATGSFTLTDGTVRTLGDAALAFKPSGPVPAAAPASPSPSGDQALPGPFDVSDNDGLGRSVAELRAALQAGVKSNGLSRSMDPGLLRLPQDATSSALPEGGATNPPSGVVVAPQNLPKVPVALDEGRAEGVSALATPRTFPVPDDGLFRSFGATEDMPGFGTGSGIGEGLQLGFQTLGGRDNAPDTSGSEFANWAHLLGATQQQGDDLAFTLDGTDPVRLNVAAAHFSSLGGRVASAAL